METGPWIIPLSLLGFIGFWSFVIALTSRLGGWWRLAHYYRDFDSYYGRKLYWKSGNFGAASYGGILTFGANYQGLYLSVNFLFSMGHPALFIPWNDIQIVERQRFFSKETILSFEKAPGVKLTVPSRVMRQVQELKTGNLF